MMRFAREIVMLWFVSCFLVTGALKAEEYGSFWATKGQQTLESSIKLQPVQNVAKNVIFFLGDGMGIPSITAIRMYKGQKAGKSGEEEDLCFDKFPYVSLAKTYALDRQNPDSANTATAYFCGVKANFQTIGVDGRVKLGDCQSMLDPSTHVDSVLKWAQDEGKWTGLVTSARVTHATPAGLYAHVADRYWESATNDERCSDIATQLIRDSPGKDINVIFGGGTKAFLPSGVKDFNGETGNRSDSIDLLEEWVTSKKAMGVRAQLISDYESFQKIDPDDVDYVLGLFNSSHLPYITDRPNLPFKVPTLVELTTTAIKILQRGDKGYFLAVEGARIDMAHHENWAKKALEEGVEFDQAIQAAIDMTNSEDTLIVVTADHSHTFTIGGNYPKRGNNILGLGGVSDVDKYVITTLNYANGPGYVGERSENLTEAKTASNEYRQETAAPLRFETHGAEDVSVYATGPKAHLFHGVHDQSYIPYVIGYASCMGPNKDLCTSTAYLSATLDKRFFFILLIPMYIAMF